MAKWYVDVSDSGFQQQKLTCLHMFLWGPGQKTIQTLKCEKNFK